jgi:hypothetical protein
LDFSSKEDDYNDNTLGLSKFSTFSSAIND